MMRRVFVFSWFVVTLCGSRAGSIGAALLVPCRCCKYIRNITLALDTTPNPRAPLYDEGPLGWGGVAWPFDVCIYSIRPVERAKRKGA